MKQIALILLACISLLTTKAQELVFDENAEVRTVAAFDKLEVNGAVIVYLTQGKEQGVAVSTEDAKNINKVKTEVSNGTLKISVEGGSWNKWSWGAKKAKAYITYAQLKQLEVSGTGLVSFSGDAVFEAVKIQVSGASVIKGKIKGDDIKLEISGASAADISGSAKKMNLEVSGASSFKGYEFATDDLNAEASGASSIKITVNKVLNAEASGASAIQYKGNPTTQKTESSGASSIKKRTDD